MMKTGHVLFVLFLLLAPVFCQQNQTFEQNARTGQSWFDSNFVMPVSNWISGLASGQSRAITEADKAKGQEFAKEFLGWLEWIFPKEIDITSAGSLVKLFAAGLLIFFFLGQLNPNLTGLQAGFITLIIVSFMDQVLMLGSDGWYTFLVNFAPALLVYLVVNDLLAFLPTVSSKTGKWVALFCFAFTYLYQPTDKMFENIFGKLHSFLMSYYLIFAVIIFVLMRIFGLFLHTLSYQTALDARAHYNYVQGTLARHAEDREPLMRRY